MQNAAEVVSERERLSRIVSGATGMAIIETDEEGRITLFNPGAESLLGYSQEEVLGHTVEVFHTPNEIARQAELLGVPPTLADVARASSRSAGRPTRLALRPQGRPGPHHVDDPGAG